MAREEGEDTEPLGVDGVELLDRPVVPRRAAVALDDARASFGLGVWQPRLPHLRRHRIQVEVVVAGVDTRRWVHASRHPGVASGRAAITSLICLKGGPAVVPPSTGSTM